MGLKKIADAPRPCMSREHNPPQHAVYKPGTYEWTCPACGKVTRFTVPMVVCHYDGKHSEYKGWQPRWTSFSKS